MSNKFPGKLWQIVNDCKSGAISWGQSGQTIVVHHTKFQEEFLDPTNSLFKTKNIGSFIRQLNLYGFRKLNALRFANSGAELREIHEFQNDYFVRDRAHLLSRLRRNVGIRRSREAAVEKRLDEIHGYTAKRRHLLELQGTRYLSLPAPAQPVPGLRPEDLPTSPVSSSLQMTTTGQWPVYMQWDGQSYKYVVLPDTSQHTAVQPVVQVRREMNGETFQVLHLPETGRGEPAAGDYVLLSLLPEKIPSSSQPQLQPSTGQVPTSMASLPPPSFPSPSLEYSTQDLYQLAELLASNPQCAIAAAQQLLSQSNQELTADGIAQEQVQENGVTWSNEQTTESSSPQLTLTYHHHGDLATAAASLQD